MAKHLAKTYGARSWEVCELAVATNGGMGQLVPDYPYLVVDVIWACREYACTVEDVLSRRTRLAFLNKQVAKDLIPVVANIMARELGWDEQARTQQIMAAESYIESYGGSVPDVSTREQTIEVV